MTHFSIRENFREGCRRVGAPDGQADRRARRKIWIDILTAGRVWSARDMHSLLPQMAAGRFDRPSLQRAAHTTGGWNGVCESRPSYVAETAARFPLSESKWQRAR